MRQRRAQFDSPGGDDAIVDIIKSGTARANTLAEQTLWLAKQAMHLDFFPRELRID